MTDAPLSSIETAGRGEITVRDKSTLDKARTTVNFLINPKTGPQPTHLRTRAFLRSLRYVLIFAFYRLVRYAKYAAVGALVAAVSGTALGSVMSGAAFVIAPTGILGGAGIGLLWAVARFGFRRARSRMHKGVHDEHADPRKDEHADAEGSKRDQTSLQLSPRTDPW